MNPNYNIKEIRKFRNITQKELSERIGVTSITIQNYENNRREPNIETLNKIANALDVPLKALTDDNYLKQQDIVTNIKELLNKQGTMDKDITNLMNFLTEFINNSFFLKLLSIKTNETDIDKDNIIFNQLKGLTQDEFINLARNIYNDISKIILDRKDNPIPNENLYIKFVPEDN